MTVALGLLVVHWLKHFTVNQKILSCSPTCEKDLFSYGYTQPYPKYGVQCFPREGIKLLVLGISYF